MFPTILSSERRSDVQTRRARSISNTTRRRRRRRAFFEPKAKSTRTLRGWGESRKWRTSVFPGRAVNVAFTFDPKFKKSYSRVDNPSPSGRVTVVLATMARDCSPEKPSVSETPKLSDAKCRRTRGFVRECRILVSPTLAYRSRATYSSSYHPSVAIITVPETDIDSPLFTISAVRRFGAPIEHVGCTVRIITGNLQRSLRTLTGV